jgi:hypothetical protein
MGLFQRSLRSKEVVKYDSVRDGCTPIATSLILTPVLMVMHRYDMRRSFNGALRLMREISMMRGCRKPFIRRLFVNCISVFLVLSLVK